MEREPVESAIDVVWLLRNMLPAHDQSGEKVRALATCRARWLDGELITNALRSMSRLSGAQMLGFGTPQGFLPLRQQMQTRLAELEIGTLAQQIVLASGITQAIDLIARLYVKPGDAVIVGDPVWFRCSGASHCRARGWSACRTHPTAPTLTRSKRRSRTGGRRC